MIRTLARGIAFGEGREPVQHDVDRTVALMNAVWWAMQRDYDRADALIDAARGARPAVLDRRAVSE